MPEQPLPRILPNGDTALTVEFGRSLDEIINRTVLAFDRAVAAQSLPGIVETVPTYRSLLIHYDPLVVDFATLRERLLALASRPIVPVATSRRWRVPVVYGGEYGIDLDDVAKARGLTPDEVAARHMAADYFVAMVGFTPGFAYLSGLDPSLATPRRHDPRLHTPPGSIHIGGAQAAIQCLAGPSGWHLLGRTPVRTFHPGRDPVFLIAPGDAVTFYGIAADRFAGLDRAAERGEAVAQLVAP
ncbi:MAG: 5-oxoprolinase subunit PxpB [Xanthobacteraceae bacterium]